jgi:hypothetical protein
LNFFAGLSTRQGGNPISHNPLRKISGWQVRQTACTAIDPHILLQHNGSTGIPRAQALYLHREAVRLRTTDDWRHTAKDTAEMAFRCGGFYKPEDLDYRGPN